jgi:hypothetical protein
LVRRVRDLARCEAQDDARPHGYYVPDRADVIEWLEEVKSEVDWTIQLLREEPDAPKLLKRRPTGAVQADR